MSSITLIGTGNMARTIGTLAVKGGNTVEVMGRDRAKAEALAQTLGSETTTGEWGTVPAGEIVITALLYDGVVPVVTEYGDALAGKIVVDISNPFNATADGLAHDAQTSIAAEAAGKVVIDCTNPLTADLSAWLEVPEYSMLTAELTPDGLEFETRNLDV